jgi:hypothetical protein
VTADSDRQPPDGLSVDRSTASGVLRSFAEAGIAEQFRPGDDPGTLRCSACETTSEAAWFDVIEERRLEGTSDPDDMVLIVAASCPACGAKGAVVLGYGPESSAEDADVVASLPRRSA